MFRLSSMVWALTAFAASFAFAGDVRKRLCSENMLELVLCIKRENRAVWGEGGRGRIFVFFVVNPGWGGFEKDNCREPET